MNHLPKNEKDKKRKNRPKNYWTKQKKKPRKKTGEGISKCEAKKKKKTKNYKKINLKDMEKGE